MVTVRPTLADDRQAVLALVAEAFPDGGAYEVEVVEETWRRGAMVDLVAEEHGAVVGHVMVGTGDLAGAPVAGLAPLAVAPHRQRQGIGTALVRAAVDELRSEPVLLLLGSPGYYGRFGFRPAGELGIHYGPAGEGNPAFQALVVSGAPTPQGEYRYCWELREERANAAAPPCGDLTLG